MDTTIFSAATIAIALSIAAVDIELNTTTAGHEIA